MNSANNTIEVLKQHHNSFMQTGSLSSFFVLLADYVKFVSEDTHTAKIIAKVDEERKKLYEANEKYEKETLKELELSEKKLLKIVSKNNLNSDEKISEFIKEIKDLKNGQLSNPRGDFILSSAPLSDALNLRLDDIARRIKEIASLDLIKEFVDDNTPYKNIHGNFTFSKTLWKRREQTKLIDTKVKTELWGTWHILELLLIAVYQGKIPAIEFVTKHRHFHDFDYIRNLTEVEQIKDIIDSRDETKLRYFNPETYKQYGTRIHNHLLKELLSFGEETKKQKSEIVNLYLNKLGELWREPKEKYCYPMGENSDRYNVVRFLAQNTGYQKTTDISSALNGKNEQTIRKEIGKINENFREFLKTKKNKLIEGKKGSGYGINSQYKIQLKQ